MNAIRTRVRACRLLAFIGRFVCRGCYLARLAGRPWSFGPVSRLQVAAARRRRHYYLRSPPFSARRSSPTAYHSPRVVFGQRRAFKRLVEQRQWAVGRRGVPPTHGIAISLIGSAAFLARTVFFLLRGQVGGGSKHFDAGRYSRPRGYLVIRNCVCV